SRTNRAGRAPAAGPFHARPTAPGWLPRARPWPATRAPAPIARLYGGTRGGIAPWSAGRPRAPRPSGTGSLRKRSASDWPRRRARPLPGCARPRRFRSWATPRALRDAAPSRCRWLRRRCRSRTARGRRPSQPGLGASRARGRLGPRPPRRSPFGRVLLAVVGAADANRHLGFGFCPRIRPEVELAPERREVNGVTRNGDLCQALPEARHAVSTHTIERHGAVRSVSADAPDHRGENGAGPHFDESPDSARIHRFH